MPKRSKMDERIDQLFRDTHPEAEQFAKQNDPALLRRVNHPQPEQDPAPESEALPAHENPERPPAPKATRKLPLPAIGAAVVCLLAVLYVVMRFQAAPEPPAPAIVLSTRPGPTPATITQPATGSTQATATPSASSEASATATLQLTSPRADTSTPLPTATLMLTFTNTTTPTATIVLLGEMVPVPAGNFTMGCATAINGRYRCDNPGELPLHAVSLDAYQIDKFEVTNAQYAACMTTGRCAAPFNFSSYSRPSYFDNPTYANYPVVNVDWYQAQAYCIYAGKRLPSEAEWEKAARGPGTHAYPWGDGSPDCPMVNYNLCVGDTSEVGSYPAGASPYGAQDMAGNVWEWVSDWYNGSYYGASPSSNPSGPGTGTDKVLRGGSWFNIEGILRVSDRTWYVPGIRISSLGFRCAR